MRISDWSSDVCSSDLLCCRWCTHFVKYVTLRGLTLSNLGNARQAFVRLVGDVRMRRARGSAFLSEINPTAGPIATGRREQLTQGPDKDRNAQPATDILGPGRLGHHVVASCGPVHIPVVRLFRDPQRGGAV